MANTYLYRQCDATASSGYSSTWTWSGWVKRSKLGSPEQGIFMNKKDSDNTASRFRMSFGSGGNLLWECKDSSNSDDNSFVTNMLFRDTNAWYHIVFSYDSSQGTEANRLKLWVNGVDIRNDGGGFSSINEASSNFGTLWSSASKHFVGRTSNNSGTAHIFDGLMSHVHLTYGTTYTASTFGSTDSTTGEWKINTSPSVTYGSQGYFLFKNDNSVNDDGSEGNNFTLGGGTLTKTEDCPSSVFATLNPLSNYWSNQTFSYGNNKIVSPGDRHDFAVSTLGMNVNSGKYYAEFKLISAAGSAHCVVGISDHHYMGNNEELGQETYSIAYVNGGTLRSSNTDVATGVGTYTAGDIIGVAVDMENLKIYWHKNGTYVNSGVPTSGSTGTGAVSIHNIDTSPNSSSRGQGNYFFAVGNWHSGASSTWEANFGNGYFGTTAVSSAGTNASNNGIFEYDVPAGYTALSTKGLNL